MINASMGDTFFSVIMSCYNSESFVEESVFSVISQSYCNWELIIVDDCSTDSTYPILRRLAHFDRRISIYRLTSNQGPAFARNLAASHAQGDWLAILDSDDIFMLHKLHFQNQLILNSNADLVLVASNSIHFDSTGVFRSVLYPHTSHQLKRSLFNMSKFPPHSSIVFRTSTFNQLGGYNQLFQQAEDYNLFLRFSVAGEFASVMEPLIKYRVHSTSLSNLVSRSGHSIFRYGLAANILSRLNMFGLSAGSESSDFLTHLLDSFSVGKIGSFFFYFERFKPHLKGLPVIQKVQFILSEFIRKPILVFLSLLFFLPWCRSLFLSALAFCYFKLGFVRFL